jgi:hypothetical protein
MPPGHDELLDVCVIKKTKIALQSSLSISFIMSYKDRSSLNEFTNDEKGVA